MSRTRDSFKRFILTILEILPNYIASYPQKDQILLNDFLNVLRFHEVDKIKNRIRFSESSEAFIDKYYRIHKRYYELPYLWFAIDYISSANRILNSGGFHADKFNQYLIKHLRGNSKTLGFFQLIKNTTPLTNLNWEVLQYSCNKFTVPLTQDQLLILKAIYHIIPKAGLRNITRQRLKTAVENRRKKIQFNERKKRGRSQDLRKLFILLNAHWTIRPYPNAFGLDRLFFNLQLGDSTKISEILGFKDPDNTTLASSTVYRELNFNNYYGILFIPTRMLKPMETFLRQAEEKRKVKIISLEKILDIQVSRSLTLYKASKGWQELNSKEMHKITQDLKNKKEFDQNVHQNYFISPRFYTNWNYRQNSKYGTPDKLIELYCDLILPFTFDNLLSRKSSEKDNFRFSEEDRAVLTHLHKQSVIQLDFDPIRLMRDFSLDEYWIKIPDDIDEDNLLNFIGYLPDSHIISTNIHKYLWTRLTSKIVRWIKKDLKWPTIPIIEQYGGKLTQHKWYDYERQEWRTPKILIEN